MFERILIRMKFSVLMSVYIKEKSSYFHECMESILNQTVLPDEIVIVEDGPISKELREEMDAYSLSRPGLIKKVQLEKNQGLGLALAAGILHCGNELVARMDTDDICVPDRFERQLKEFKENPTLDICGSHIKEFDQSPDKPVSERRVPLSNEEIRKYQKKRSAFNHMTVMFKKSAVLKAGNYQHAPLMEDDLLWCNMLKNGCRGKNIDAFLVYARTGEAMINRRGGKDYLKKYIQGRRQILQTGYISVADYYVTIAAQAAVALMPTNLRYQFFQKVLRK